MANHSATIKNIRKVERRAKITTSRRRRIRGFVKQVEVAIAAGNKEEAQKALRVAQKELSRGVSKGVLKSNSASRKISRLNARVKNLVSGSTKSEGKKPAKKAAGKRSA